MKLINLVFHRLKASATIDQVISFLLFLICLTFFTGKIAIAQDDDPANYNEDGKIIVSKKGFHTGIYVGTYFANSYSASLYDGYGFDYEESKNTFDNSWMKEKIIMEYGGGYGNPDIIAEVLQVPTEDWNFDESDMPTNMRYKTAFSVGVSGRYSVDENNAAIVNVTAAILTAAGNFTITTRPPPNSTQVNNSILTCNISGKEQRLLMQAGVQHLFGKKSNLNFFIEGGLHATLAQFDENEILIKDLRINLLDYYEEPGYPAYYPVVTKPVGLGFGAFAGLGFHLSMSQKWNMELVYNPTLEKINMGPDPKMTFNQSAGLRAYYKLSKQK